MTARAARATAQAPAPASSLGDLPAVLRPAAFSWTIVPHTHWDREWYQPFEAFRWRLARMLDELLDLLESEPRFEHFTLDGQSAILDDYLELHPHQAPRVRALLESGRLVAGPAYVLPDEFLAPQEALVRNLLIGQRVARALGAEPMAVGYQPDPFGHVAQMPQVLRGFGIDSFIFWRGMGDQAERLGSLFSWRGPDGSEVLAIRQLGGYGNASQLGRWGRDGRDHGDVPEERETVAIDRLQRYLDRWGDEVGRDAVLPLLLCNGSDHEPAWRPLPELVEAIRGAYPGIGIRVGTYTDHVARVRTAIADRQLPVVEGELREGRDAHILRGIDSIRMDLKQANERVTQRLLGAETLASLAWLEAGAIYPQAALGRAWTQLLRNQPHDSISGCSVDAVHREMRSRGETVEQLAARIETEALAALAGTSAPWIPDAAPVTAVSIVNPLPWARTVLVELPLTVAASAAGGLRTAAGGTLVPAQRRGAAALVAVTVDGFGAVDVRKPASEAPAVTRDPSPADVRVAGPAAIENERYRVEAADDGSLSLLDRRTGYRVQGIAALEDVADRGDEYDFCPIAEEIAWSSRAAATAGVIRPRIRIVSAGPVVAELEIRYRAILPARLDRARHRRVGRVRSEIRIVARLAAGIERLELAVSIDNQARDHRLRIVVPSPEAPVVRGVRAEGHFAVIRRPALPVAPRDPESWVQLPQPTNHSTGFVAAGPVVVTTRGLPEYEAVPRSDGGLDLAVTLLRCVGWLSRDDLSTRRNEGAGPSIETPEAQAIGEHTMELAVSLDGALDDVALVQASVDYRQPARVGPAGIRPRSALRVGGDVAFAALKGAEDGDGLVLRVYNPGAEDRSIAVTAPDVAGRVRLDESSEDGTGSGSTARLAPGEIASLRVRRAEP